MKHLAHLLVLLLLSIVFLCSQVSCIRVENLRETGKDSTSISIEWSLSSADEELLSSLDSKNSSISSISDPLLTATSQLPAENTWVGFKIKYFTDKLQYTPTSLRSISLKKFRIDNLKSATEYKIQVSAFNSLGNEGPASNLIVVKTNEAVPGEPQDFKATKITSHSIELEWKPPRKDEQSSSTQIKGYEIHYFKVAPTNSLGESSKQHSETQIFKRKTNDKKLRYTLVDLEPNTLYKIQIFAYNMKGDGQRSNQLNVVTMDVGPNKPENIRSEIQNNLLHIKWQAPLVSTSDRLEDPLAIMAKTNQQVGGYRIYFNNEKYEVDAQTLQISFQRPKWDYDRQYEFRIAAKSIQSKNVSTYGQEAVYRISTHTNDSKIVIQLEKLTSTSVVIKWNNITFASGTKQSESSAPGLARPYYKLAYWLKTSPENSIKHDQLINNELRLVDLRPNSDYIVQIVAINGPMSTDVSLKHFHTLVDDIKAPLNLELSRYEADKLRIRWDPVVLSDPSSKSKQKTNLITGYKIYYKELVPNSSESDDYPNQDPSDPENDAMDEWKYERQSGMTEVVLDGLNINSDYAIKVTAVDAANNEGAESETKIATRLIPNSQDNYDDENRNKMDISQPAFDVSSFGKNKINDKIGMPRELEVIEFTSTSVKFSWMPPAPSNSYQIKYFLISYVDRIKHYRETNGSIVSYLSGLAISVKVPARDDPTIKITWLVNSLSPNTEYDFNISAVLSNMVQGPPVQKMIRTKRDRPFKIDRPIVTEVYSDSTVLVRTGNASEKNGRVSKYWLVVTPILSYVQQQEKQQLQNFETREKDINNLLRYSLFNSTFPQYYANESTYIAAEFEAVHWPQKFLLGDGRPCGRFINRRLVRNMDYKAYIIAFTDEQNSASENQNMLDLTGILKASAEGSSFIEGDLFSSSMYSDMFNTKQFETSHNPIVYSSGVGLGDYYNILWIVGAIASFIFIIILVIVVSVHLMQKKRKSIGSSINNSQMIHTLNTRSTQNTNNTLGGRQMETSINKMGTITTNTLKNTMHHQIKPTGVAAQQLLNHRSSVSSAASSTTASPTTALLSCSVNNNSSQNVAANSQNSNNTNNTNVNSNTILITNGLLTAASPLHHNNEINNTTSPISSNLLVNPAESLYTSIEVTQKLLQQQLSNPNNMYDNNSQAMMMMLMNNNNSFSTGTSGGTLTRNANMFNTLNSQNYDPIELRRMQYQTMAMQSHPAVQIDDLAQHIERLKAQNNAKFSLEYESIEPGQQFQWENSIMDLNRQKNRYANVIAYDHSRVILSKLPASCYSININSTQISPYNSSMDPDCMIDVPPPPPSPPGCSTSQVSPATQSSCSDYINANFLDGYRKRNAYIATQGPLGCTFGDFWRMIWEQQTCTIVMMTKLEERNRLKCDQYWPSKGTQVYGNVMQVTLVDFTELATYSMRTFVIAPVNTYAQLQLANNSQNMNYEMRREIKHFQYTAWPDHGVPDHPTPFLMFLRRVRNANPPDSGPIVAHCSAGVGRTGCYIVIDSMLERIKQDTTVDIYGYVTCLRAQRNYMVQTEDQYIFCYDAVLEASQSGLTEVHARNLYQHLQRLLQISPDDPQGLLTEMELEYKRLSNIKAPQSKFQSANLAANKFKNRLVNILPYEATRVCLQHLPNVVDSTGSDYINANFIDGYKYKKAYIATQAPLTETIDDFWRMLWEHNSTIIVMLTKLREMGREKCAQYWPSERSIRYQYFVVDPIAEYNMSQYILREFKVTDARDGQSRTIRQFQFVDWPEQGVPKSGESIIELIGQVHKTKEQFGQTGPICVHCSAGVGRTGVFITLSIVLERMRYEGIIDVYNTVKVLRTQRPAMVQTEDQYQFCYKTVLEYLGSFDNYE